MAKRRTIVNKNAPIQNENLQYAEWKLDEAFRLIERLDPSASLMGIMNTISAAAAYAGDGAVYSAIERAFDAYGELKKRRRPDFDPNSNEERAIDWLNIAIGWLQVERDRRNRWLLPEPGSPAARMAGKVVLLLPGERP